MEKRVFSFLLAVAMLCAMLPQMSLRAIAQEETLEETTEPTIEESVPSESVPDEPEPVVIITRAQWVTHLVETFVMYIEGDNYPDNYYSDINAEDAYYRDIMIAVEFGVVDIPAGQAFCPEEPTTRAFATHTLNFCLGFRLSEDVQYTYSDVADVDDTAAAQIALNRNWVSLIDEKFMPEQPITEAECTAMLADAQAVLEKDAQEPEQENSGAFADGVVIVPQGTAVALKNTGELEITDCPVTLAQGDIFVVYDGEMPIAFAATAVSVKDNTTTVSVTTDGTEGAMTDLYFSGTVEADLEQFVASDATSYVVEEKLVTEGPTLYGISYDNTKKVLNASKTISLRDGLSATVRCDIKNVALDLYCDKANDQCRAIFNGNTKLTASVYGNAMQALTGTTTITLGYVPILYGVGFIELAAECSLSGEIALVWEGEVGIGFSYDKGNFRIVKEFTKKNFSFSAELSARVGIKQEIGIELWLLNASIWASAGAQMDMSDVTYTEGTPERCKDFEGYLYLKGGAQAKIFGIKTYKLEEDILKKHNSPVRVHYHYEDGNRVTACTRSEEVSGYHTDMSSQYYNSSYGNVSSTYTNSTGQTVKLWQYTLDGNNQATITGYGGSAYTLNIPASIDGYPVISIGSNAFSSKTGIGVVSIPRGVTTIGSSAFSNCTGLANILIPDSVIKIGSYAFDDCESLTEVTIPGSGVIIDYCAFINCTGLEVVKIPDSALFTTDAKHYGVFNGCDIKLIITYDKGEIAGNLLNSSSGYYAKAGITEIEIEEGVTAIGASAFCSYGDDRSALKKVTLPSTVTSIGASAFYYCSGLTEITMPQGSKDILVELGGSAFFGCSSLKSITVPEGVTQIQGSTFSGCVSLESVTLPTTVVSIGNSAFYNCKRLPQIDIPVGVNSIGSCAFSGCESLTEVTIPGSGVSIDRDAFINCTGLGVVKIPDSALFTTDAKHYGVFNGCDIKLIITYDKGEIAGNLLNSSSSGYYAKAGITEIEIEEGVTAIGASAFCSYGDDRSALKKVTLPSTVTSIGASAFYYCSGLTEITMPQGSKDILVELGGSAFFGCSSLKSITVPEGVTQIQGSTFSGCVSLESVTLPTTVVSIGNSAFYNCKRLPQIDIPVGVNSIGSYAFYGCESLSAFVFGPDLTQINKETFYGCTNLTSIAVPAWIISIGDKAFYGCTALEDISVYDCTTYGMNVFGGDSVTLTIRCQNGTVPNEYLMNKLAGVKRIVMENEIFSIGSSAFKGGSMLESVVLPSQITGISHSTFYGCSSLKEVNIHDRIMRIGDYAFYGCTSLEQVAIPDSVSEFGTHIFDGCTSLETVKLPTVMRSLPSYTFYGCTSLKSISLSHMIETFGSYAFYNCTSMDAIPWTAKINTVEAAAFRGCDALIEIDVPDTVVSIGSYAFTECGALQTVELPKELKTINSYLFYDCDALESYVVPDGIKSVGEGAFKDCDALITATIPSTVTSVGASCFYDCDALTTLDIAEGVVSIGASCFYDCDAIEELWLPKTVTTLGKNCWYSCDSLRIIKLSEELTAVPEGAFMDCAVLPEVYVPRNVTSIGANAFNVCPALVKVTIPQATTTIAGNALAYPDRLVVYGLEGSYAQTFAQTNGYAFVVNEVKAETVTLDYTELTIFKGASVKLQFTVEPEDYTDSASWKSGNTAVVTVTDQGEVKGISVGTAVVKLVVGDASAKCKITVAQPVTKITLNKTSYTMEALDTLQITATVAPSTATNTAVVWSSSEPTVAQVDENGLITAYGKGTTTITATAADGSGITASCEISVTNSAYFPKNTDEFESTHKYTNNCNDYWIYSVAGADNLALTFDDRTEIENGFDYLYIYDGQDCELGCYTGMELAGQTIVVPGDTVKLYLLTDESGTEWGFKVAAIVVDLHDHVFTNYMPNNDASCTEDGTKTAECDHCDTTDTMTDVGSKLGHDYSVTVSTSDPNCTEQGKTVKKCSRCDSSDTAYTDALGHNMVEVPAVAPTCTATGLTAGTKCDRCGEIGTVQAEVAVTRHNYVNGVCSGCGDIIALDAPQIVVDTVKNGIGKTVSVNINLKNNPGLVTMQLQVDYDSTVLTLKQVQDNGLLGNTMHNPTLGSPYTLRWANNTAAADFSANGAIVTLIFEVDEGVEEGWYPITVSYDYDNYDIVNWNMDKVKFNIIDGGIEVIDVILGDVNGDGSVDNRDAMILDRYLAKWEGYTAETVNLIAADVNCDGSVNNVDSMILARHLADWAGYKTLPYGA